MRSKQAFSALIIHTHIKSILYIFYFSISFGLKSRINYKYCRYNLSVFLFFLFLSWTIKIARCSIAFSTVHFWLKRKKCSAPVRENRLNHQRNTWNPWIWLFTCVTSHEKMKLWSFICLKMCQTCRDVYSKMKKFQSWNLGTARTPPNHHIGRMEGLRSVFKVSVKCR